MTMRATGRGARKTKTRRGGGGGVKRPAAAKRPVVKAKRRTAKVKRESHGGGAGEHGVAWPRRLATVGRIEGCGAGLIIAERTGKEIETVGGVGEFPAWGKGVKSQRRGGKGASREGAATRTCGARISAGTCRALAAVGHHVRARLMTKLLEGPATYRALRRATGQKAGPLYHHINQLRLAGLILPKQRDLYELTRGGRNLILAVCVVGPVLRDTRRRPQSAI